MVKIFTNEMLEFIKENCMYKTSRELRTMVNEKFNTNFTLVQIQNCKANHGLRSGLINLPFKTGHIPWNKGKKMPEEMRQKLITKFKKGHKPVGSLPLGSERFGKDGYLEIKVDAEKYKTAGGRSNVLAEHTKWIPKQRKIWIDNHGDNIPQKSIIIFLDKNKFNFDINNLYCISRNMHATMCRKDRYKKNAEITNLAINLTKLEKIISQKEKGGIDETRQID